MSNVALLVDCQKIIVWLEDRKKLRKDWYDYLKAGEEKIKALLKDREWTINYPALHQYINANQLTFNYNDIAKVVQELLQTDLAQQKNIIFGYSDQRVKEWTKLKKYMEGSSLMLLSLAKFIEQSLRFDLPGLNKSIEGVDNQLATLKRKIDFNNNTIFQQRKGLEKERSVLGLSADEQQRMEVQKLIESLVEKGPLQIKQLEELIRCDSMRSYLMRFNEINETNETPNKLLALSYFIEYGDEFLEVYKDATRKEAFGGVKKYKQFEAWKGRNEWEIEVQGQQHRQQIVIDHATVIESREFRQQLLYNLNQLLFFYKGLKHELLTADKTIGIDAEQKSSSIVEGQADKAISQIQKIIAFLTSRRLTAPLQLKNSKKAYQLLVNQFRGYEANIAAMDLQIRSYKQQIIQFEQKRQKEVEKLSLLRAKVVSCKAKCESWLSELVKREVKLTGEINRLQ